MGRLGAISHGKLFAVAFCLSVEKGDSLLSLIKGALLNPSSTFRELDEQRYFIPVCFFVFLVGMFARLPATLQVLQIMITASSRETRNHMWLKAWRKAPSITLP